MNRKQIGETIKLLEAEGFKIVMSHESETKLIESVEATKQCVEGMNSILLGYQGQGGLFREVQDLKKKSFSLREWFTARSARLRCWNFF